MPSFNRVIGGPYNVVTSDGDASGDRAGAVRVMGMYIEGGSTASQVAINDALTKAGGGTTITLNALINDSNSFNFGPGGIVFGTGLSVTITGTGATAAVTYVPE